MYAIDQSPLYKLRSKAKLCSLLNIELTELLELGSDNHYKVFEIEVNGKKRQIEEPARKLRRIHNKLSQFLRRVVVPDYLHSGVKKRSNVTNAASHEGDVNLLVTDISKFYPSTTEEKIFRLFKYRFLCASDIAWLLTKLVSFAGHVPTGSSLSMSLAYWANAEMFDELSSLATKHGVVMTVYVDDLTFSGKQVNRLFRKTTLSIIRRHGLVAHKAKTQLYAANAPKLVTGVVLKGDKLKVRNQHHKNMYADIQTWEHFKAEGEIPRSLLNRLVGRLNAMSVIDKRYRDKARTLRLASVKERLI